MCEVVYGTHGRAIHEGNCPRCGKGIDTHGVPACTIDDATCGAVSQLIAASKSIANQRTSSREVMRQARVGAITQQDVDEAADRMVGALWAQTTTGKNLKLVAISGPPSQLGVHGWTAATAIVPADSNGWTDIYGRSFTMPLLGNMSNGKPIIVGQPCAAIKLLLSLGKTNTKGEKFNFVHLYEEACRGEVESGKKSKKLAKWKGQGVEYTYAAHSCEHCEARVPALLCDRLSE